MKALLLAAGFGTRLKPLTNTIPKCLAPINNKPLLDYWLELLINEDEISEIFINLHYLHEKVIKHLDNKWSGTKKIKTWFEPELLGTAGTIAKNAEKLCDEPTLVIHADNFSCFQLKDFIHAFTHKDRDAVMTMMLFETNSPESCGIVELNKNNLVINMHEKVISPPSNLANGAVYIIEKEVVNLIKKEGLLDFSCDVIPLFFNRINSWLNTNYHRDIGSHESLAQANLDAKQGLVG